MDDERAPYDPMPHGPAEVGVGPWPGEWPTGEQYDAHLLAEGDRRNVVDRYRYWRLEAIVADLDTRRHDFHVAIENWQHDLNIGTVVRTANAFLAAEVHIVGHRRWNRRGRDGHRPLPARAAPRHGRPSSRRTWASAEACGWSASTTCRARCRSRRSSCRVGACCSSARRAPGSPTAPAPCATRRSRSPSTARPARSTPGWPAAIAMHTWIRAYADLGDDAWRG